jgi:hypothetical protein
MKHSAPVSSLACTTIIFFAFLVVACDRSSSPEGRMSIKIENLQKELVDSLQHQNRAILDSLGKIREELNELKRAR